MTPSMKERRVAVVGGRRARQGIGEFVARAFARAGARVAAVCTSSRATAAEAVVSLRREYGIEAQGFDSVEGMLRAVPVDIVAVCSPFLLHREHLEAAARFPAHVLCEKPFWWSREGPAEAETRRLAGLFDGRVLRLVTQWPYTLAAFRALHGDAGPVRRFEMRLSPITEGRQRILDSAPHLISMLQALAGRAEARDIRWEGFDRLSFRYGDVEVEFVLRSHLERPRPAWYAINGFKAERSIRLPDYAFEFSGGGRIVPAPDPLDLLVKDFLEGVEEGMVEGREAILDGMALLRRLFDAAPA
jgi:hypothetical protein